MTISELASMTGIPLKYVRGLPQLAKENKWNVFNAAVESDMLLAPDDDTTLIEKMDSSVRIRFMNNERHSRYVRTMVLLDDENHTCHTFYL